LDKVKDKDKFKNIDKEVSIRTKADSEFLNSRFNEIVEKTQGISKHNRDIEEKPIHNTRVLEEDDYEQQETNLEELD